MVVSEGFVLHIKLNMMQVLIVILIAVLGNNNLVKLINSLQLVCRHCKKFLRMEKLTTFVIQAMEIQIMILIQINFRISFVLIVLNYINLPVKATNPHTKNPPIRGIYFLLKLYLNYNHQFFYHILSL